MRVDVSPYQLRSRHAMSGAKAPGRDGFLLRIETVSGVFGYADVHAWPELGDEPIQEQRRALREGRFTRLLERAFVLAREDAEARAKVESLFAGLDIPPSHFLITDIEGLGTDRLAALEADGFRRVKLKTGRHPSFEIPRLARLAEDDQSNVLLRLDMNAGLTAQECRDYLLALPVALRERIEFVEDPCAFDSRAWTALCRETGVRCALDREGADSEVIEVGLVADAYRVLVLKPSVQDEQKAALAVAAKSIGLVVTSYLGHPLGQASSAVRAGRLKRIFGDRVIEGGFFSHTVYEPNEFSERLRFEGPRFLGTDGGPGLGFAEILERLPWSAP